MNSLCNFILANFYHSQIKEISINDLWKLIKSKNQAFWSKEIFKEALNFLNEHKIIFLDKEKIILILNYESLLQIGRIKESKKNNIYHFKYFAFDFKKNTVAYQWVSIYAKNLNKAYPFDLVLAYQKKYIIKKYKLTRFEAVVIKILRKEFINLVGYIDKKNEFINFHILNAKLENYQAQIINLNNAFQKNNHAFIAKIIDYQPFKHVFNVLLETDLGNFQKNENKFRTIIAEYGLNFKFNDDVLKKAQQLPKSVILKDIIDLKERKNLTDLEFVTIDGVDAKDLDDAIYVKELKNTNFNLKVAIADVSYYVQRNSTIDLNAKKQISSMYLVNYVKPMLPVELSNNLCSLNYNQNRLVLILDLIFNKNGQIINSSVYKGIINSFARLNYQEVNSFFKDQLLTSKTLNLLKVKQLLNSAFKLYQILNKNNLAKGFINVNSFDSSFKIDPKTEKVIDVYVKKLQDAEKLIETFMIAANQEVAKILASKKIPALYRIHNCPKNDKLLFLKQQLNEYQIIVDDLNYLKDQKKLKTYIDLLNQKSLPIISSLIFLRSMQKASYSPINKGHFCLCSKYYTHFTSPIRRYPDLLVHRLLKTFILKNNYSAEDLLKYKVEVNEVVKLTKNIEPIIINIEREASKFKKCQFLMNKFQEIFEGTIISVLRFGFFVMLENGIEGLVHVSTLSDDFYDFDETNFELIGRQTQKKYCFKDQVKVRLKNVDVIKRVIDFQLV